MNFNWIVFTDIDGTLLDNDSYSFAEALPAINFLLSQNIPIIPCTSKTHPEVIRLRQRLKLNTPFIVENGSAIFSPPKYFAEPIAPAVYSDFETLILGKTYQQILECFRDLRESFGLNIRGFSELTVEEIAKLTQLSPEEAELARKRFFSEPFVSTADLTENDAVLSFVRKRGCRLLKGNRFFHLLGDTDKGKAVHILSKIYKEQSLSRRPFKTIGLGDSKNDFDLLAAVDQPVLVRKKDGTYVQNFSAENLYITRLPGPAGWREAIEFIFNQKTE
jgi:mannosyl-3-phosphoglycerate phosphatase